MGSTAAGSVSVLSGRTTDSAGEKAAFASSSITAVCASTSGVISGSASTCLRLRRLVVGSAEAALGWLAESSVFLRRVDFALIGTVMLGAEAGSSTGAGRSSTMLATCTSGTNGVSAGLLSSG
jgi:hypothetical protein